MPVKFSDVVSKSDMVKISVLLVVALAAWSWVWSEYKKPILPEDFETVYFQKTDIGLNESIEELKTLTE